MFKSKVFWCTALALAGLAGAGGTQLVAQNPDLTTWSGVYTTAQADRGAVAYNQRCASCHGVTMDGTGEAPGISGPVFSSNWNGQTLGDLHDRIKNTMPFDAPGSLDSQTVSDVMAFVLKTNGFPAGNTELNRRGEMLTIIKYVSDKPANAMTAPAAPAAAAAAAAAVPSAAQAAARPAAAAPVYPAAALQPVPTGANAPNSQANPYTRNLAFFELPAGRTMGSTSGVAVDSKGNIWVADRCGVNSCANSPLDPIMMFDSKGKFVRAFGGGRTIFPHGFYIDAKDNVWVTDARVEGGKGGQVLKFSPSGQLLLALGKEGVSAVGPDTFTEPCAVVVGRDGTIYVADGHTQGKPARIMVFSAKGKFLRQFGTLGSGAGQLDTPHAIAMDSRQRIFVGDRWNNRVQIFDRSGRSLASWYQFGRPSGVYIDRNDVLYVADSESRNRQPYGYNPNFRRGIRIGSARTGAVTAFIPDPDADPDSSATSGAEGIWADRNGVIYGAQVKEKLVARYTK